MGKETWCSDSNCRWRCTLDEGKACRWGHPVPFSKFTAPPVKVSATSAAGQNGGGGQSGTAGAGGQAGGGGQAGSGGEAGGGGTKSPGPKRGHRHAAFDKVVMRSSSSLEELAGVDASFGTELAGAASPSGTTLKKVQACAKLCTENLSEGCRYTDTSSERHNYIGHDEVGHTDCRCTDTSSECDNYIGHDDVGNNYIDCRYIDTSSECCAIIVYAITV